MNSGCILFTGVNEVVLGETDIPAPGPHEVLIETIYSSVSAGTELRCLAGLQAGVLRDKFPFIPGYGLVGRVVQPDQGGRLAAGTVVFCPGSQRTGHNRFWGGHVQYAVASVAAVVPVPAGVDLVQASLAKLAAIAHRGVVMAAPQRGQTVAVVGLGPIGQLSARLFARTGARVIATDLSAERVEAARKSGLEAVLGGDSVNRAVRALVPEGVDIVVDATGHPAALRDSAELVRDRPWVDDLPPGGQLVVQGSYAADVLFPQDTAFMREMRVLWPRDCMRSDLEKVLRAMADGLQVRDLAGEPYAPGSAPEVYQRLRTTKGQQMSAAFAWKSED